jgi:CheY-like chemotaxis protein
MVPELVAVAAAAAGGGFLLGRRRPRGPADRGPEIDASARSPRPPAGAPRPLTVFETGVAHLVNLLNNRLSSILSFSELVDRTTLPPREREALEQIGTQVRDAAQVVRNLSHLVQPPSPGGGLTHLPSALTEALRQIQPELIAQGISVRMNLDPSASMVAGNQADVVNLFVRLLRFAQSRIAGSPPPREVTWAARALGASVVVTQVDSGPALPAGVTLLDLNYFRPADPAFVGHVELALAQRLAENCTAALRLEGDALQRAEVTVTMIPGSLITGPARHRPSPPPPNRRAHVLVADDDEANRNALAQLLETHGHRVTVAADGQEALDQIGQVHFDAVVTDLHMPRLGGRELFDKVAAGDPALARHFVFVTGDHIHPDSQRFLRGVPQPVIQKPYEIVDLLNAISEVSRRD